MTENKIVSIAKRFNPVGRDAYNNDPAVQKHQRYVGPSSEDTDETASWGAECSLFVGDIENSPKDELLESLIQANEEFQLNVGNS